MKIRSALLITIMCVRFAAAQQKCDCEKELKFVKDFIEANYVGFADKVNSSTKAEYDTISAAALQNAKAATNPAYCIYTLQNWLAFFKDGHIQLIQKPNSPMDSPETISLTQSALDDLKSKPTNDIEGFYMSETKNYEIAVFKNNNPFRDYAGVIVNSKIKTWKPGQVKLELKKTGENTFTGIYYMKDHHSEAKTYTLKDGRFDPPDFYKSSLPAPSASEGNEPFSKQENSNSIVFYKDIDDSIAYLRIKSFDEHYAKKVASEIRSNEKKIKSKPYLILDLRYNGGGVDYAYQPILPFIYTNPIKTIGTDIYSTPGNIQSWLRILDDYPKLPKETKDEIARIIELMKKNPGQLISVVPDQIDTLKTGVFLYPKKIAVLIDDGCASSTEQFLLTAKQSTKVVTMGKHTAGILDYSNLRMVDLPTLNYILGYSTTKSRRIPKDAIDNIGVKPDIELIFDKGWLDKVKQALVQK